MAAAIGSRAPEVVHLHKIRARDLAPLLEEEIAEWRTRLCWDFRPSADLVRRYVAMQSLAGFALVAGGAVVGYSYLVHDQGKGLIGDLFLMSAERTPDNELLLIEASVSELFEAAAVDRVESQLMLVRPLPRLSIPYERWLRVHPRNYMMVETRRVLGLKPAPAARTAQIETWSSRRQEEAAEVIAEAYQGHVDGQVNDQYLSLAGARRFLNNLLQYPGCGSFFPPASHVAVDVWTGRACGISLASILSEGVGHITQICVVPALKGRGLGYELLRRSLLALAEAGCHSASLTVTASNTNAVGLYQRVGFHTAHEFSALVWDRA
ncbi:MAG: GNAT family N-acetyltransferase [Bryobacteraceae bacterium]